LNVAFSGVSDFDTSPIERLCNAHSQSQSKFFAVTGLAINPNARVVC
jgi:hypothetical protein